jgi:hypothetical protein
MPPYANRFLFFISCKAPVGLGKGFRHWLDAQWLTTLLLWPRDDSLPRSLLFRQAQFLAGSLVEQHNLSFIEG